MNDLAIVFVVLQIIYVYILFAKCTKLSAMPSVSRLKNFFYFFIQNGDFYKKRGNKKKSVAEKIEIEGRKIGKNSSFKG